MSESMYLDENVMPEDYKVDLEVFEGPLDLLLYLIRKHEIDIHNIPIETITTQYMEYLQLMKMLDLNIAGDFLVMASTLMLIKSRMLLPKDVRPEMEEDDEEEDPRWDLVRQLVEYKKFKDAAMHLEQLEIRQENIFELQSEVFEPEPEPGLAMHDVGIFDLIAALNDVLKNVTQVEESEIVGEQYTVADKIDYILKVTGEGGELPFRELFGDAATRGEIVATFLALLELIKISRLSVKQGGVFAEITVLRADR